MATKVPVGFMAPVLLTNFRDLTGNPTTIDRVISTTVSDDSKAEIIEWDGVPHVAPLFNGNAVGDGQQVITRCDVRLGDEVVERDFIGTFDVPAGDATTATVTLGDIVPRP